MTLNDEEQLIAPPAFDTSGAPVPDREVKYLFTGPDTVISVQYERNGEYYQEPRTRDDISLEQENKIYSNGVGWGVYY